MIKTTTMLGKGWMISLSHDGVDAGVQRSLHGRIPLQEQPPDLPLAVCGCGQPSPEEDGGSCAGPGSVLPPCGSWRDMEDHAAPAVDAMCGRTTLAIFSGF